MTNDEREQMWRDAWAANFRSAVEAVRERIAAEIEQELGPQYVAAAVEQLDSHGAFVALARDIYAAEGRYPDGAPLPRH